MTAETQPELHFLSGYKITHVENFASELSRRWGRFGTGTPAELERIIENAENFVVTSYVKQNGVYVPAGILRTILTYAPDGPESFATNHGKNFDFLTEDGTWDSHDGGGNLLTMVDLTVFREFEGKGYASEMVKYALERLPYVPSLNTYSPDMQNHAAENLHAKHGAARGPLIPNARPGHEHPNVLSMVYRWNNAPLQISENAAAGIRTRTVSSL